MLKAFLSNQSRIILLFLILLDCFRFQLFSHTLININEKRLFFFIVFLCLIGYNEIKKNRTKTIFDKTFDRLMILLVVSVFLNCFSCLYYRDQTVWETMFNWSPILLLFLFYPLSILKLSIKNWENVLYVLFLINLSIRLLLTLYPPSISLFQLDVSYDKFANDQRLRLFSDGILFLGNLYCLNKSLTQKKHSVLFLCLYITSLMQILLMGFRTVISASVIISILMFLKCMKKMGGVSMFFVTVVLLLLFFLSNLFIVQYRVDEILNRNRTANFSNEEYVRVLLLDYYYTDYFKSNTEMILGSGMVKRVVSDKKSKLLYPSEYSKEVSTYSDVYHFYPVDMGLIGLSWEAGIPAVIVMIILCCVLIFNKQDDEYLYIRGWGLFLLLISITVPFYYYNKNILFTVIVLIIFMKLKCGKLVQVNE